MPVVEGVDALRRLDEFGYRLFERRPSTVRVLVKYLIVAIALGCVEVVRRSLEAPIPNGFPRSAQPSLGVQLGGSVDC